MQREGGFAVQFSKKQNGLLFNNKNSNPEGRPTTSNTIRMATIFKICPRHADRLCHSSASAPPLFDLVSQPADIRVCPLRRPVSLFKLLFCTGALSSPPNRKALRYASALIPAQPSNRNYKIFASFWN